MNNIVEQDHRAIKRRVNASQGFRSFHGARRTIQGYEVVHMIRKGQVRWLPKGDVLGLIVFLNEILRTERGMKSLRDAYLRGIQRLSSFATLPYCKPCVKLQWPMQLTDALCPNCAFAAGLLPDDVPF